MGADKSNKGVVVGRHLVFTLQVTVDDTTGQNHSFLSPTTAYISWHGWAGQPKPSLILTLVHMGEQVNAKGQQNVMLNNATTTNYRCASLPSFQSPANWISLPVGYNSGLKGGKGSLHWVISRRKCSDSLTQMNNSQTIGSLPSCPAARSLFKVPEA